MSIPKLTLPKGMGPHDSAIVTQHISMGELVDIINEKSLPPLIPRGGLILISNETLLGVATYLAMSGVVMLDIKI